jgi:hypothetical protein
MYSRSPQPTPSANGDDSNLVLAWIPNALSRQMLTQLSPISLSAPGLKFVITTLPMVTERLHRSISLNLQKPPTAGMQHHKISDSYHMTSNNYQHISCLLIITPPNLVSDLNPKSQHNVHNNPLTYLHSLATQPPTATLAEAALPYIQACYDSMLNITEAKDAAEGTENSTISTEWGFQGFPKPNTEQLLDTLHSKTHPDFQRLATSIFAGPGGDVLNMYTADELAALPAGTYFLRPASKRTLSLLLLSMNEVVK